MQPGTKKNIIFYSNQVPGTDWLNLRWGKQKKGIIVGHSFCDTISISTTYSRWEDFSSGKINLQQLICLAFLAKNGLSISNYHLFVFFEQVLTSDLSCQVTTVMGQAVLTASSWYLVLMAVERFTSTVFARSQVSIISSVANTCYM